ELVDDCLYRGARARVAAVLETVETVGDPRHRGEVGARRLAPHGDLAHLDVVLVGMCPQVADRRLHLGGGGPICCAAGDGSVLDTGHDVALLGHVRAPMKVGRLVIPDESTAADGD